MKTVCIDGEEYVRQEKDSEIKIAILQRGWVAVGRFSQDGEHCRLENAAIIRVWGTTKGLGEIALNGPTAHTKLDKCPPLTFHELTVIALMNVEEPKWADCL